MKICKIEGCYAKHRAKGYCQNHYDKARRKGVLDLPMCSVEGCNKVAEMRGLCSKHGTQMTRHNKIFERTWRDPNEILFDGSIAKIILQDREHAICGEAIIDREDFDLIKDFRWRLFINPAGGKYCVTMPKKKMIFIQHIIMGKPRGVDHINRDGLDNRKNNLRSCTHQQNNFNKGPQKNNTSGFKGVHFNKGSWQSEIWFNQEKTYLGRFCDIQDAARAYDSAAERLFGEFAYLNKNYHKELAAAA